MIAQLPVSSDLLFSESAIANLESDSVLAVVVVVAVNDAVAAQVVVIVVVAVVDVVVVVVFDVEVKRGTAGCFE